MGRSRSKERRILTVARSPLTRYNQARVKRSAPLHQERDSGMAKLDITIAEPLPLTLLPSGAIRIRGTRVSLDSVIYAFEEGETPEEIMDSFPTLKLADIYAVIAFYLRHRDQVQAYLEESRQRAEVMRQKIEQICPPDGFRERLMARRAEIQKQEQ
jgi:uncharacterized protein (DUF433 family)